MRDSESSPGLMTRLCIGEIEIFSFVENRCYADGGSMYGVIPKTLWSKLTPCDENNLVPLDTNLLLVKADGKRILIECGIGDSLTDRERKVYACYTESLIDDYLRRLGVSTDMIDFIILTHLHLDHVGGAFVEDPDGAVVPRFPNARHIVRQEEWESAMNPDDRSTISYPTDRLKSLEKSGVIELIDSDTEVIPGIWAVRTGGHTRGHQIVTISSDDSTTVYCGDLIPTTGHLRAPYIAGSDLFPLETLEHKKKLTDRIIENEWIVAFDHDLEYKFATLSRDGNKIVPTKVGEPFLAALRTCEENLDESRRTMG